MNDRVTPDQARLLDAIPQLEPNLSKAPQLLLRRLFDATQLTVTVHPATHEISVHTIISAEMLESVIDAASPANTKNAWTVIIQALMTG